MNLNDQIKFRIEEQKLKMKPVLPNIVKVDLIKRIEDALVKEERGAISICRDELYKTYSPNPSPNAEDALRVLWNNATPANKLISIFDWLYEEGFDVIWLKQGPTNRWGGGIKVMVKR